MRTLLRLLPLLIVLGVTAVPAAAQTSRECQFFDGSPIANCTSMQGPSVSVPTQQEPDTYGGIWNLECPTGQTVVGSDWSPDNEFFLHVYLQQLGGQGLYGSQDAFFLAINETRKILTFVPVVGCIPNSAGRARAAGLRGVVRRVFTHNLQPNREATHRQRCRSGERFVHSTSGVGFFEPPSARELRDVTVEHRERRGRAIVNVMTGPRAGDDERVALQIHVTCRR